jgi:DNA ligase-1
LAPSDLSALGPLEDWLASPDRGGTRLLLVRHPAETRLWADGSRLLDTVFPEVLAELTRLDAACVIEAEVVSAPRAEWPATVLLHDLLSLDGEDLRGWPWERRHERLARWLAKGRGAGLPACWRLAEAQPLSSWQQAGGMLLKRRSAVHAAEGACWRVAAPPTVVSALLLHAQAGSGRDAGLYVDCTLAVWNRRPVDAAEAQAVIEAIARQAPRGASGTDLELLPLGRTSDGLDEAGRRQVDRLVRASTVARHGPVRSLRPERVFELAFDGLEPSPRRRSGVALRAPRLLGPRDDLAAHEVADLATLLSSMKS